MKRYILKHESFDHTGVFGIYPRIMASKIKSQEVLDWSGDYFPQFFPDGVSFDGMFLTYGSDRGVPKEPHALCDMHSWIESKPPALVYPVSPRFHDLLLQFHIPEMRFYKGDVLWKNEVYPYYVMHLLTRQYQYIDFRYSTFVKSNFRGKKESDASVVQAASIEELNKIYGSQFFTLERTVMHPEFLGLDMYDMDIYGIIISERLKEAIEQAHLTGVKIMECPLNFEFSDEM